MVRWNPARLGRIPVSFKENDQLKDLGQPRDDAQLSKEPPITLESLTERLKWELEIVKVRTRYDFFSYATTVFGVTIVLSVVFLRASPEAANHGINVLMDLVKLWVVNKIGR